MTTLKTISKIYIAILLVAMFLISMAGCDFIKKEVSSYESSDGSYTLHYYQKGSPAWPYGSVKVEIGVKEQGKRRFIDKETFSLNNDGAGASEFDIKDVRWFDERVEIDIKGADDSTSSMHLLELRK